MPRPSHSSAHPDQPTATTTSTPSPLHRLPVNPRRKKVAPDERKRVATACNSCNVRRIKCSGEKPCRQCATSQRECLYPEPVERVTVPKAELESLRRRVAELESQLASRDAVPTFASSDEPCPRLPGGIDGRMLADPAGTTRYLGETSGATFLDTLKELINTATPLALVLDGRSGETPAGAAFLGSVGQYQTHDSRPLRLPDVNPYSLPPEADITATLTELCYFIRDGHGAFASGGTLFWPFEDPKNTVETAAVAGNGSTDRRAALALCHMALAFGRLLRLREPGSVADGQLGEDSFARARLLLGNLLDRTTYTTNDIAVLALMALYLIENNRRDAAYVAVSNAMTISVMNGLHRGSGTLSEIDVRTFWTVYVLDRWLGCVMGRPPTIPDDAITLPLPRECPGLPSPAGLRAHIELCKISDYIVYSSYRAGGSANKATAHVDKALELLRKWHAALPPALCLPDPLTLFPPDPFTQAAFTGELLSGAENFGQDRAAWALHMNYNQLVILSVRPAMLMAVWKAIASIVFNINQPFDIENHPQIEPIRACSDAARRNLRLGRLMRLRSPRQKLLLQDLHNIFNAAVILTMHQIVFVNLRTQDLDDINWAADVFESEAQTGSEYARDCEQVLRDLKYLCNQLRNPIHDPNMKQVLLSQEGVLRDFLPPPANGETSAATTVANGGQQIAATPPQAPPSAKQGDTLYQRVRAIYQTLACWWKADYMQFYNTFLS